VPRRICIRRTALTCAFFLCVELFLVSPMPSAVSFAGSIYDASIDSSGFSKPYRESGLYWIQINIPAFKLTLFSGESPVKEYPIAVGKPASPSRIGTCKVVNKAKYPTWYPPDGRSPVPPGPDNPISCRWLGLSWAGYGIHGTNNPASIGKAVTSGCIRMRDKDVMELFDIVPIGTKVEFTYETIEVSSYGDGPMAMLLTVHQDLYQRGTNTAERVIEALRTSLVQIMLNAKSDIMSDAISPAMPDIDRHALAALIDAARGKPEPVPWQVRVEISVVAEPVHVHLAGDSQRTADSADMTTCSSSCKSRKEGDAFAAASDTSAGVSHAYATTGNAYAEPRLVYAIRGDICSEADLAYAITSDTCGEMGAASTGKDCEKAVDTRILSGASSSACDEAGGGMNAIPGNDTADTDPAGARDSVRVEMDLARIEGDRVLVALRPVAEAFGYKVGWDARLQSATVDQKDAKGVLRGGRFHVSLDELQRLLEDVAITWDPQTLTLRITQIPISTRVPVDWWNALWDQDT